MKTLRFVLMVACLIVLLSACANPTSAPVVPSATVMAAIIPTMTLPTASTRTLSDEITNFSAVELSSSELTIQVDYVYSGIQGNQVWVRGSVFDANGNQLSDVGYVPSIVKAGAGSSSFSLKRFKPGATVKSERVRVCLYIISGVEIVCREFRYAKTWGDLTTPTVASTETVAPTPTIAPTRTALPTLTPFLSPIEKMMVRCPTVDEVAVITKDLKIVLDTDPTAGTLKCTAVTDSADLTELQRYIYQALVVMKNLKFSKPVPWTNKPIYDWFIGQVKGVRVKNGSLVPNCCDATYLIALPVPGTGAGAVMYRPGWGDPLELIGTLLHEARHAEGYPHTCEKLHPGGQFQADKTLSELGAYAVSYYFDKWLADYSDPNFVPNGIRQWEQNQAIRQLDYFCETPKLQ